MVIYEVSLAIDKTIYPQFQLWLRKHIREMLQLPGFIQASVLKPEDQQIQEQLTIQYQLQNREFLNVYFTEFAPRMREEGINLFKDRFSAQRRIYEIEENFLK